MSEARERIAVDFDDVLIELAPDYIRHLNEEYGAGLTGEDLRKHGHYWTFYQHIQEDAGVSPEEGVRRWDEYMSGGGLTRVGIADFTKIALYKLKKERDLHIVTARWTEHYDETMKQIEREVPDVFDGVHFLRLWGDPANRDSYTKGMICEEIGAQYLVDDNVDHCNSAGELNIRGLLFGEYGWNINHETHPLVKRVPDWRAVLRYFNGRQSRAA